MPTLEHNGSSFQVDEDGFLLKGIIKLDRIFVDLSNCVAHVEQWQQASRITVILFLEYTRSGSFSFVPDQNL